MSDTAISVRNATRADIPRLCGFQQNMALETEGKTLDTDVLAAGTRAVFDSPQKGFYIVAESAGEVVGSLLITYEWSDWRAATFLWIQSVYVDAAWRRRGVYRALHTHVVEMAEARYDVCGVRLYVERENTVAQRTYDSLGMTRSHYDMFEIDFAFPTDRNNETQT